MSRTRQWIGELKRTEGASALEFAIIAPVLILLLTGMIEFGFLFQAQLAVTHAAREGARLAAVHDPAAWSEAAVVSRAFPLTAADGLSISKSGPAGGVVSVTVTYPYRFRFLPAPPSESVTLMSTATMRKE